MKKVLSSLLFALTSSFLLAQTGNLMQGASAFNLSMGGASTGQPLDITGALQWNPATASAFRQKTIAVDLGFLSSSPTLYFHSVTPSWGGNKTVEKSTKDNKGLMILPSFTMLLGNKTSKHIWGISVTNAANFGVLFPENKKNPINYPPSYGGYGKLESHYFLMEIGLTYAYRISNRFSIGIKPIFSIATLKVQPNPFSKPSISAGYANSNNASAAGFGLQAGLYYASRAGFKVGISYQTTQYFSGFNFKNTYHSGVDAPDNTFSLNVPAILSAGVGYSGKSIDFAIDYRRIFYKNTKGYKEKGWNHDGSIAGLGWNDVNVLAAGIQLKVVKKFPLRFGYTYSSNPIESDLAMFSMEIPAVVKHAFQMGIGYQIRQNFCLNLTFQHAISAGKITGPILNPTYVTETNPYGAVENMQVAFDNRTNLVVLGISYNIK